MIQGNRGICRRVDHHVAHKVYVHREDEVQRIAMDVSGLKNELGQIILENKVAESIRYGRGTTKGRPAHIRQVKVPDNDLREAKELRYSVREVW